MGSRSEKSSLRYRNPGRVGGSSQQYDNNGRNISVVSTIINVNDALHSMKYEPETNIYDCNESDTNADTYCLGFFSLLLILRIEWKMFTHMTHNISPSSMLP